MVGSRRIVGFRRMALSGLLIAGALLSGAPEVMAGTTAPETNFSNHAPWHKSKPVGVPFTVFGVDNVPDIHGDPVHADLVLFVGGNQFMVMPDLISAFKREHPSIRHVYYETLPPGILARQIVTGGLTIGNLHLRISPDIYESGKTRMMSMVRKHLVLEKTVTPYAKNKLGIMVRSGNPKNIQSLKDLAKPEIRLSLPNPKWEGIGNQIRSSLLKAGGPRLVREIYDSKRKAGTTYLTHIHHRETAVRILDGSADAGVTWISEVLFQKSLHHPISLVQIPNKLNTEATYVAAEVAGAPHARAAEAWLSFLKSSKAARIYRHFGFTAPVR
ncbi:MAG: putative ABC transporter, periplasmic component [Leptospirillum sp. Group IV 'UBA BS']|nr:MAG: putative ABC transporter, periplasmic component [Leptospirillum sp. Group IV 'UBA BS']